MYTNGYIMYCILSASRYIKNGNNDNDNTDKDEDVVQEGIDFVRQLEVIKGEARSAPIFRVKSVKIYTGQKKFTRVYPWLP